MGFHGPPTDYARTNVVSLISLSQVHQVRTHILVMTERLGHLYFTNHILPEKTEG
jgi:hypothetical protein